MTENGGYDKARNLEKQGATKEVYNEPNLNVHPNFNLTGVQLTTITQSLAYKGICELKAQKSRQSTAQMLAIMRHMVQERTSTFPDDHHIWKSTRHCDLSKVFCIFIWK